MLIHLGSVGEGFVPLAGRPFPITLADIEPGQKVSFSGVTARRLARRVPLLMLMYGLHEGLVLEVVARHRCGAVTVRFPGQQLRICASMARRIIVKRADTTEEKT